MTLPFDSEAWNRRALLSCAEMRRAEETAYAQGAPGFSLMMRAGLAVADEIQKKWQSCKTLVLCGPGNNGGDGLVAAEALRRTGWDVTAAALIPLAEMKGDAALAAKEWQGKTIPLDAVSFDGVDLAVVALFGTGLQRPVEGIAKAALEKLAQAKIPVVAVDLPSGVNGDTGAVMGAAPRATLTVTFFRKKPGHLLLPGAEYCGETLVADIGIAGSALAKIHPMAAENARELWIGGFPFPQPEGHKYTRGHALIHGGAVMTGATRLAARAAQRMGAGLITLAAPSESVPVYAAALESVIVRPADDLAAWRELLADPKRDAILIGPGLGTGAAQGERVLAALETQKPAVLDADALTLFAKKAEELIAKLHPQCVLTPHEGEFARLFGGLIDMRQDKLTRARRAASMANCVILLKGADTVIAAPDGYAVINANAPPWLATGGAGDVLSGMILGLVAQHMPVFAAAAAAAWLHGSIAAQFGPGLIAEDLVSGIPAALGDLSAGAKNV